MTSVVQRLDDISNQFDGVKTQFPITVNSENVIANANQLMIVLNGVAQTPNTSFEVQGDSIVFAEPPQPPASVKYVNAQISQISTKALGFILLVVFSQQQEILLLVLHLVLVLL